MRRKTWGILICCALMPTHSRLSAHHTHKLAQCERFLQRFFGMGPRFRTTSLIKATGVSQLLAGNP